MPDSNPRLLRIRTQDFCGFEPETSTKIKTFNFIDEKMLNKMVFIVCVLLEPSHNTGIFLRKDRTLVIYLVLFIYGLNRQDHKIVTTDKLVLKKSPPLMQTRVNFIDVGFEPGTFPSAPEVW